MTEANMGMPSPDHDHDPYQLQPDHLPTPFTADEIREGSPPGLTIRLLVEVPGEPPRQRINRFVECDGTGAVRESLEVGPTGTTYGPPTRSWSSWMDLQAHASFPAATTQRDADVLESPLGELACLRYTVVEGDSTETFWFAPAYPGMPVKVVRTVGESIVEVVTMTANDLEPAAQDD